MVSGCWLIAYCVLCLGAVCWFVCGVAFAILLLLLGIAFGCLWL